MFKNFFRDSIGFTFANIFIKALNLLLIPLYVRFLSYEDYGVFELVSTLTIIFVVVVSLELTQAILRFVSDQSSSAELQSEYIKNGLHVIFISSIVFISFIYIFSSSISEILFDTNKYKKSNRDNRMDNFISVHKLYNFYYSSLAKEVLFCN